MQMKDDAIHLDQDFLNEIVARLRKIAPSQIFLFGSQAEGTADADSDIDLFVIKEGITSHLKESIEARRLLRGMGKAFDLILSTPEEFEYYRHQVNSVHHAVAHYGKRLYG